MLSFWWGLHAATWADIPSLRLLAERVVKSRAPTGIAGREGTILRADQRLVGVGHAGAAATVAFTAAAVAADTGRVAG